MDYDNIKNQVYSATMQALYNRVDYTMIGFNTTLDYLVIWDNNGKCNIKYGANWGLILTDNQIKENDYVMQ